MKNCFRVHSDDNVATLLEDAEAEPVNVIPGAGRAVQLNRPVPLGHKVALTGVATGGPVIKYGIRIGVATQDIHPGDWVHLHNCASLVDGRSATLEPETGRPTDTPYE